MSIGTLEVRTAAGRLECRTANGTVTFAGIASSVDSPYDMGGYTEIVRAGAFTETLASDPDVMCLVAHAGLPIARTRNGSLKLSETPKGLEFEAVADVSDPDVAQLASKVRAELLTEASFAFRVTDQQWNSDRTQREIRAVDLHRGDVSLCPYGANPNTSVVARSLARQYGRSKPNLDTYRARAWTYGLRTRGHR